MPINKKEVQIIKDPVLEPYFISRDEYSFAVKEMVKTDLNHFKSNGTEKEYEKVHGFYASISNALEKIIQLKASDAGDFDSLKEYINSLKTIQNEVRSII